MPQHAQEIQQGTLPRMAIAGINRLDQRPLAALQQMVTLQLTKVISLTRTMGSSVHHKMQMMITIQWMTIFAILSLGFNVNDRDIDDDPEIEDAQLQEIIRIESSDFTIPESMGIINPRTSTQRGTDAAEKPMFHTACIGPKKNVPEGVTCILDFFPIFFDDITMGTFVNATNACATTVGRNLHK